MDKETHDVMDSQPLPPQAQPQEVDPSEVTPRWWLVKDSRGFGSITATMLLVSFLLVAIAYVLAIVQKIGPVEIRSFDTGACASFFGTCSALYFSRRVTDAKLCNK